MGRLIDADKLKQHYAWWEGGTYTMTLDKAKKDFNVIVDVQPEAIVRCENCKHYITGGYCDIVNERYNEDEFCSRGEEKEDEPITPEMFAEKMRELANEWNEETGHICADDLMVKVLNQLGYGEGTEIFEGMSKWYS